MSWSQEIPALARRMFALAGVSLPWQVEARKAEELTLSLAGNTLTVCAPDLSGAGRGLFQAACALKEGRPLPRLPQKRRIASCGMMLDMSRGGVMTVDAVKGMIDAQAALGLNLMMLYTEDTYPVADYPYLGYLRGRYTVDELRELDGYAASSGVELVPCIQTLAHLEQFLQWDSSAPLKDNDICLLADEPKVYDFIRAELESVSRLFRSRRVHIGMDEAHGIGLGRYYTLHGPTDRFALLTRHLTRVVDICRELGLHPIMWSDMFYRLGSAHNDYYDPDARVPEETVARIPQVALCYWDYYHQDEAFYAGMLEGHRRMGKEVVFAGGLWTWSGFLPQVKRTEATAVPALRACLKAGVGTVLATLWGDDGCETDYRLALNQLPIYSEHCWLGQDCTAEECHRQGERLTGLSQDVYEAMGAFYPSAEDQRPGKLLVYGDPLYPLLEGLWDLPGYAEALEKGAAVLSTHQEDRRCVYAWLLLTIAQKKLAWISALRPAYIRGDRAEVGRMARENLPALHALYKRLMDVWRDQWEEARKRNGWETPCARLGAVMARLEDAQHTLLRWAEGLTDRVDELDEQPLPARRMGGREDYHTASFPQYRGN